MALKLFVVHGMGDQLADWHVPAKEALVATYETFRKPSMPAFDNAVEWHEVLYADIFMRFVEDWRAKGEALWPLLESVRAEDVREYAQRLRVPPNPGFLLTHAADVVLYHTCPQVRQQVLNVLVEKIANTVGPNDEWGVLAHSLGTSVAHDAIHQLWNTQAQFGHVFPKASFVFMVANVSRALEWACDTYLSHVKPAPRTDRTTACVRFVNVRHKWDPFPMVKPFQPEGWPGFEEIAVQHWGDRNVHGFSHYLDHPAVHCELFRRIFDFKGTVSKKAERVATDAYLKTALITESERIARISKISKASDSINGGLGAWRLLWEALQS